VAGASVPLAPARPRRAGDCYRFLGKEPRLQRGSDEALFVCARDALVRAGLDPASELACLARRRESVARCFESGSPQDTDHTRACLADLDAICAFSPGYEAAIAECPGGSGG